MNEIYSLERPVLHAMVIGMFLQNIAQPEHTIQHKTRGNAYQYLHVQISQYVGFCRIHT